MARNKWDGEESSFRYSEFNPGDIVRPSKTAMRKGFNDLWQNFDRGLADPSEPRIKCHEFHRYEIVERVRGYIFVREVKAGYTGWIHSDECDKVSLKGRFDTEEEYDAWRRAREDHKLKKELSE